MTEFKPTHLHKKTNRHYQLMARGKDATNKRNSTPVCIYRNDNEHWFVRESSEFDDGRFIPITEENL